MKQLIRRFTRVADSTHYTLLQSNSPLRRRRLRRYIAPQSSSAVRCATSAVPVGHVPVYVGDDMVRFVVSADLLNHPVFVGLILDRSVQEYGYAQKGVLHIPCQVAVFERVVETLRLGIAEARDDELRELLAGADDFNLCVIGATE